MLLQIHTLTSHTAANLNRDETGAPKTTWFGGALRGRISSQCLKRTVRLSPIFRQALAGLTLGVQTNTLPYLIEQELLRQDVSAGVARSIAEKARQIGSESQKATRPTETEEAEAAKPAAVEPPKKGQRGAQGKNGEAGEPALTTSQLMRLSSEEPGQLARALLELYNADPAGWPELSMKAVAAKTGKLHPHAVDIALFGRFVTSDILASVPAATQVAHAFSTNQVQQQDDFFVGVDDLAGGSPMLGTTFFNAATYYAYANVDLDQLTRNLGGPAAVGFARQVAAAFVPAFIQTRPAGFQNAFASLPLPDFVLVELVPDRVALSYANAFLAPVRPTADRTLMDASVAALLGHIANLDRVYPSARLRAYLATHANHSLPGAVDAVSLPELTTWLGDALAAYPTESAA